LQDSGIMQTLLQLNPPIPMKTPRGEGLAVMVIDYGPDFDLWWTVILSKGDHAGEIWTYANPEVRGVTNITLGRPAVPTPTRAAADVSHVTTAGSQPQGFSDPMDGAIPKPSANPRLAPMRGRD
jgi:hypothetical protein